MCAIYDIQSLKRTHRIHASDRQPPDINLSSLCGRVQYALVGMRACVHISCVRACPNACMHSCVQQLCARVHNLRACTSACPNLCMCACVGPGMCKSMRAHMRLCAQVAVCVPVHACTSACENLLMCKRACVRAQVCLCACARARLSRFILLWSVV